MKINTRVGIMMAIILFLGGTGYFALTYMNKKMAALEVVSIELDTVSRLNLSLHEAVSYLNNYVVKGDPEERERFKEASERVRELFDAVYFIEEEAKTNASLENAKKLWANIEEMAKELFKYKAPLSNKDAVALMFGIQQTTDLVSRLYIRVHNLKDKDTLERIVKEAESARKWVGWVQIIGTIIALIAGFILLRNKQ